MDALPRHASLPRDLVERSSIVLRNQPFCYANFHVADSRLAPYRPANQATPRCEPRRNRESGQAGIMP
jgi:hypothetical protein